MLLRTVALMALTLLGLSRAQAAEADSWYLQTSVYTKHFSPSPEHNNHQDLIGLEYSPREGGVYGAATFRNSFRQRTHYLYAGKRWQPAQSPFYAKVTAGAMQGYRGEHRDKIPFNQLGVAAVIVPSLGVQYRALGVELVLLGNSAAMLTSGVRF